MKKSILIAFLTVCSLTAGGCSIFTPFKPINTCGQVKNGGANCASIESNLEYSIETDGKSKPAEESRKSKKEKTPIKDNSTAKDPVIHSDTEVEKAELIRLITVMNINSNVLAEPVLIPPSSYKVVVLPYSDGKKFYSGRNIYIVAGKPRWVAGDFLMGKKKYKINNSAREHPAFDPAGSTSLQEEGQKNGQGRTSTDKEPDSEKVRANFYEENEKQDKTTTENKPVKEAYAFDPTELTLSQGKIAERNSKRSGQTPVLSDKELDNERDDEKVSANFSEENETSTWKENDRKASYADRLDITEEANYQEYLRTKEKPGIFKHRVSAYLLNCRDMPGMAGNSIAVFEKDRILDITDKSAKWWRVKYHGVECYVNSSYLYGEPES